MKDVHQCEFSLSLFLLFSSQVVLTGRGFKLRQDSRSLRPNCTKKLAMSQSNKRKLNLDQLDHMKHEKIFTLESLLAELEVQCEPVEDEVAEEVVEIEDLQ